MKNKVTGEPLPECDLYLSYLVEDEDSVEVPLATLVTVFVVKVAEKIDNANLPRVRVYLKPGRGSEGPSVFLKRSSLSNCSILKANDTSGNDVIGSCVLPAIHVPELSLCVTGLCSGALNDF
jgi:hypothetical protein